MPESAFLKQAQKHGIRLYDSVTFAPSGKLAMDLFIPEYQMTFPWLRRAAIAVIGFTVLAIGLAMVVLPGPAIVVIPLGLTILATEFVWARRLLQKARATIARKVSEKKEA